MNVLGDSNRLMQIMMNLVTNAITYSPDHTTLHITIFKMKSMEYSEFKMKELGLLKKRLVEYLNVFTEWIAQEVETQVELA